MNRQLTVHLYRNWRERSKAEKKYDLVKLGSDHEQKGIGKSSCTIVLVTDKVPSRDEGTCLDGQDDRR